MGLALLKCAAPVTLSIRSRGNVIGELGSFCSWFLAGREGIGGRDV